MNSTRAALLLLSCGAACVSAAESPVASPGPPRPPNRLGIVYSPPSPTTTKPDEPHPTAPGPLVILPQLDVRADRIDLDEHEVLTSKGALDLAKKRHLSPLYRKTLGPLSLVGTLASDPLLILGGARSNDAEALTLHREEERIRRRSETAELIDLIDDPALSKELRRSTATSFRNSAPLGERRRE